MRKNVPVINNISGFSWCNCRYQASDSRWHSKALSESHNDGSLLTSTLMDSMTSIKTSFFLYLIPSDLQETALVTVVGTFDFATSSLAPSWVMYLQRGDRLLWFNTTLSIHDSLCACVCFGKSYSWSILLSVVCGKPKSISSSSSS